MKLYLMRHGDYVAEDVRHGNPLSEKGQTEVSLLAEFLNERRLTVSRIVHSEKLRAQQTANLIAKGFFCDKAPEELPGLNPADEVETLAEQINAWEEDVVIVGHLPFLGRLTGLLVVRNESKEIVSFQAGTIVCLEKVENTRWIINWVLGPGLFRIDG